MASSRKQISLKVLIHKQEQKVVLAEANSDFVDILFSFLTMPMGTIVRLLSQQSQPPAIGSFNNLYKSIANLDSKYFASEECKDMLLNTKNSAEGECQKLKINIDDTKPLKCFICARCTACMSMYRGVKCTICPNSPMTMFLDKMVFIKTGRSALCQGGVFVSPTTSFIITDNLNIIPNIPTSIFAILKSSGVADFGLLEEKIFTIGSTEIVELLKASILSNTCLTSIFMGKNYEVKGTTVALQTSAEFDVNFKKMTVKVLVQKSSDKILLAYCSEDFIDFLFNFVTIPRVIGLGKNYASTRGVDNIHQSVSNLNVGEYFNSQQMKDMLQCPQMAMFHLTSNQLSLPLEEQTQKFYIAMYLYDANYCYLVDKEFSYGNRELKIENPTKGGYLKRSKFMVTDDLVVSPLSSLSCIRYLQSWEVSSDDTLEQMIEIGIEEAVNLMRESFVSASVLTNGLKHLIETKLHTKGLILKKPKNDK